MTTIKCRYSKPCCYYESPVRYVTHSEYWFCDDGSECPIDHYTRPENSRNIVNPTCSYCGWYHGEFETTVKRYSYIDGELKVKGQTYMENEIEYLEIDGRILVP